MQLRARMRAVLRTFDLSAYLKQYDPDEFKEYGNEIAVRCPNCEKDGKLWVLVTDRKDKRAGKWVCYYCDEGGHDIVSLVRRIEDCSLFRALEILTAHQADKNVDLHTLIQDTLFGVQEIEAHWDEAPIEPVPLPDEFLRVKNVDRYQYFKERGITQERADAYGLGVCKIGKYANRLVVPVVMDGKQLFWVARYMRRKPPRGLKKTLYPVGAKPNRALFNYDVAKKFDRVYLVEDVFSAMAIGSHAMATFGTQFSQYQMDLLLRSNAQEVIIMWDRDDGAKPGQSGYEKAQKLAIRLSEFWTVRNVRLPDERDPDEMSKRERVRLVRRTPILNESNAWRAQVMTSLGV